MAVDACSNCGARVEEYARGGGPNNARCPDCKFEKPPSFGTVEYARKHGIPPHGSEDDDGGVFA